MPQDESKTTEQINEQNQGLDQQKEKVEAVSRANEAVYERIVANVEKAKEAFRIEEEALKAVGDRVGLLEREISLRDSLLNNISQLADKLQSNLELQKELENSNADEKEILNAKTEAAELELRIKQESLRITKDAEEQLETIKKLGLENNKALEDALKIALDQTASTEDRIKAIKTIGKESEKEKGRGEKVLSIQRNISKAQRKVAGALGISADASDTFVGSLLETVTTAKGLTGPDGAFKLLGGQIGLSVKSLFSAKNILGSVVKESFKLAVAFDQATKAAEGTTGAVGRLGTEVVNSTTRLAALGTSAAEIGKNISALQNNFSAFNADNDELNENLLDTTQRLKMLGVSASESAKTMDFFSRVMGQSGEQSRLSTIELVQMGLAMNKSASQITSDFAAAQATIIAYGDSSMAVFKDLAVQSKATGIEMGRLVQITSQFDEFDKAAAAGAKLNAVLGTQISPLEMVSMNEAERLTVLRQQVNMSVGNFESLDKFTKMYIAQAMGVKDIAEAQRLLNMSQAEAAKYNKDAQERADAQKELQEMTARLVPVMTQLGNALIGIVKIASPLIDAFGLIGDGLTELNVFFDKAAGGASRMAASLEIVGVIIKTVLFGFLLLAAGVGGPVAAAIAGVTGLLAGIRAIMTMRSSPETYNLPLAMAQNFEALGSAISRAKGFMSGLLNPFKKTREEMSAGFHGLSGLNNLNVDKLAGDLERVKASMLGLAGTKIDGFLAIKSDGAATSLVMGSEDVVKNISEGKISVDVSIPEIAAPNVSVKVYLDGQEMSARIHKEFSAV